MGKERSRIFLTGASSYVGSALYRDLTPNYDVVGTCNANQLLPEFVKLDLTKQEETRRAIKQWEPEKGTPYYLVHTANYPNSRSRKEHSNYDDLNMHATESLVRIADELGMSVIFISSTAAETDSEVYGRHKAASEEMILMAQAGGFNLRPSVVYAESLNMTGDKPGTRIIQTALGLRPPQFDASWRFHPTLNKKIAECIHAVITTNWWYDTVTVSLPETVTQYSLAHAVLAQIDAFTEEVEAVMWGAPSGPERSEDPSKLSRLIEPMSYENFVQSLVEETRESVRLSKKQN